VTRPLARGARTGAAIALVVLLAGCAAVAPRGSAVEAQALDARAAALAPLARWTLTGRVAVSDGRDGGSGRFEWTQDGERYVIEIRAPVSQQTWRLSGDADQCQLDGAKPHAVRGTDPEALLERELGWRLPVAQMRNWVRALAAEPRRARLAVDADGRPRRIEEGRWTVEYKAYDASLDPPMPTKVFAERRPYKVRLAIASWTLHRGH
jgi:outer membrane lipoprotein LolB